MKNSFKLGFLALAITMSVAACNSNKTSTSADSTSVSSTDSTTSTTTADSTGAAKTDSAATGTATGVDTTKKM